MTQHANSTNLPQTSSASRWIVAAILLISSGLMFREHQIQRHIKQLPVAPRTITINHLWSEEQGDWTGPRTAHYLSKEGKVHTISRNEFDQLHEGKQACMRGLKAYSTTEGQLFSFSPGPCQPDQETP